MQNGSRMSFTGTDSWTLLSPVEQSIKQKIETVGVPLRDWDVCIYRGILTGFNEAFIISGEKKDELISIDPKSAEIIRPILRGRDIKRYGFNFADLWLIVSHNGVKEQNIPRIRIEEYPAIKAHLDQYYEKLMRRADKGDTPYNLRNCVYMDDFSKPKIIWGNLCLSSQFAFTEDDYYINAPSPMIVPGTKYLVAVLNSKLADWYIRQLGVTRNGGYFEYKPMFVEKLPVPHINADLEEQFNSIVDLVLLGKETGKDTSDYEEIIDNMVFNLYGLTEHERSYVLNGHEKEADATC
jgi:adenine-specific DNA-methyltransferase